ncbi:MAG: 4Fe-4S binding protein [Promethearchaeia archaeon]
MTDQGELAVSRQKCFGCGLCVSYCQQKAIKMLKR